MKTRSDFSDSFYRHFTLNNFHIRIISLSIFQSFIDFTGLAGLPGYSLLLYAHHHS